MGREIEMKIPLSEQEYKKLLDIFCYKNITIPQVHITELSKEVRKNIKSDEYWSRYDSREERIAHKEPQVIRIRTERKEGGEGEESFFTLKHKTRQNGIELNREDETFIQDPEVLREFFTEAGYHQWFKKTKESYGSYCTLSGYPDISFHVEIEEVNGLKYVETEVTQDDGDADYIKDAIGQLMKICGLDPEKKDSRSWVEIIG